MELDDGMLLRIGLLTLRRLYRTEHINPTHSTLLCELVIELDALTLCGLLQCRQGESISEERVRRDQKLCSKSFPITDIVHYIGCSPFCSGVRNLPKIWVYMRCSLHVTPVHNHGLHKITRTPPGLNSKSLIVMTSGALVFRGRAGSISPSVGSAPVLVSSHRYHH